MPAVEVHGTAIGPVVVIVSEDSLRVNIAERRVAQILRKSIGDLEHRVVLELIAVHRLQRMVDGIASVAPFRNLPHWARKWIGVHGGYCVCMICHPGGPVRRDRQLCCKKPVCKRKLIGVDGILQVNSPVRHPAEFQLAVPPKSCFSRQVPLPTVGLLRAGVNPLVPQPTQRSSEFASLRGTYALISWSTLGKIVSRRLKKWSRPVQ